MPDNIFDERETNVDLQSDIFNRGISANETAVLDALRFNMGTGRVDRETRVRADDHYVFVEGTRDGLYESVASGKPSSKKLTMEEKVSLFLQGNEVEGINQEIVDAYFLEEKKKRFLKRGERDRLHKPCSDGKKPTSSVKVDDIVPA